MNQIKWEKIDSLIYEVFKADLMRTLWTEEVKNPAYPDKENKDEEEKESPKNIKTVKWTLGGPTEGRGISGYIYEKLMFEDRDSLQAKFWSSACDLFDLIHTFTVAFNNEAWDVFREYPEDDASEKDWEEYEADSEMWGEKRENDMMDLESEILDLARKAARTMNTTKKVEYSDVLSFIKLKKEIDWWEKETWEIAKKELLTILESYFIAIRDKDFMSPYLDQLLPTRDEYHFDWRINPILRDIFLGFLIRNPFLIEEDGKLLKNQQLAKLVFEGRDHSGSENVAIGSKISDQIIIKDYESLSKSKFEVSPLSDNGSLMEAQKFFAESWGNNYIKT
ncbi:uncharacterized protein METZ01_LOCUS191198 [marine metagenome]|uniref:Uncharacterized protein n=1 Tax=marine metagenome TaxID=408172 RepID=A0A382DK22_9ZZZZ